jgi:hypothetical protein
MPTNHLQAEPQPTPETSCVKYISDNKQYQIYCSYTFAQTFQRFIIKQT